MDWLLTGLTLGFVGSAHCVLMCGPLALALPVAGRTRLALVAERGLYHAARIVTYTALGVLFGALGLVTSLAGGQQVLSVVLGVLLLGAALVPWLHRRLTGAAAVPFRFIGVLTRRLQAVYQRGGPGGIAALGIMNGLLPCGLVYAAVATAVTAGSVAPSALFMAAFGAGTLPALMLISLAGPVLKPAWRQRLQKLIPLTLAVIGVLLILRGLSLGFLLSPDLRAALFTPGFCRFLPLVEPVG